MKYKNVSQKELASSHLPVKSDGMGREESGKREKQKSASREFGGSHTLILYIEHLNVCTTHTKLFRLLSISSIGITADMDFPFDPSTLIIENKRSWKSHWKLRVNQVDTVLSN